MFYIGDKIYCVGSKHFTTEMGEVIDITDECVVLESDIGVVEVIPLKFVTGITMIDRRRADEEEH